MLNGNISNDNTQYFMGIQNFKENSNIINTNINNLFSQFSTDITTTSNDINTKFNTALTQLTTLVSTTPDTLFTLVYPNAITPSSSPPIISIFPAALGNSTTPSSLIDT
jgi:hypothetical protein